MPSEVYTAAMSERSRSWYRILDQADEAQVYIYDEIGAWGISANQFVRDLSAITARAIHIHVNSPGGEVFDGIAIYNTLQQHPAQIIVTIEALAASIASVIVQAADQRRILKTATLMIHDSHGFAMGGASTMAKMADELARVDGVIADIYADRAGGGADEWRQRMSEETWYRGEEAVAAGLADEIVDAPRPSARVLVPQRVFNFAKYQYHHVPEWLKAPSGLTQTTSGAVTSDVRAAGRTMSQVNLERLHDALEAIDAVHDGTCDMGDDCPMEARESSALARVVPQRNETLAPTGGAEDYAQRFALAAQRNGAQGGSR